MAQLSLKVSPAISDPPPKCFHMELRYALTHSREECTGQSLPFPHRTQTIRRLWDLKVLRWTNKHPRVHWKTRPSDPLYALSLIQPNGMLDGVGFFIHRPTTTILHQMQSLALIGRPERQHPTHLMLSSNRTTGTAAVCPATNECRGIL